MTSHAPEGYDCPFCAVVQGTEKDGVATKQVDIVHQTDLLTAFVSSHQWPANPGHVLIVPNGHVENLYELPSEWAEPFQAATQLLARALKKAFDCPGISTRQHNEPAGGQDVWHYHVHVFPRFEGDELYGSDRQRVSEDVRSKQAEQIRRALKILEEREYGEE
ncbi:MAG: HIT family protein [Gemmatimonadetes bacterium]|jgi:histidine triad (HIT) family protein|nr:HIT family protein [Gemmatimonadota bacterium]MBT5055488.1 HIT family protein [Gemmatimonadota bacterium]MBT5143373.1 HIT family protein [Gemmatimonadota bacterium]MBT5586693.1 HIT family protein [Gemmatimonadota bacterium]MBT5963448.1 HIT family protein [Gemmatimonadota bacterium]